MMEQLTQTGAFTAQSRDIVNRNFGLAFAPYTPGNVWFVDANGGSDSLSGNSWANALHSMAEAFRRIASGDIIYFVGQVKEQVVAPLGVSNVRIIGAATRPRYGNESSFNHPLNDKSAAWRPPASPAAATPLLTLIQQGWVLDNILFDCPSDAAGVKLWRAEDATHPDPSSTTIQNCQFSDGLDGIEDVGGCYNLLIQNNTFRRLSGQGIKVTSTGIAVPLQNQILNNVFEDCDGGIVGSYTQALISGNIFIDGPTHDWTQGVINTVKLSAQGSSNFVINNYTFDIAADIDPAHGYTGSSTDAWRTFANGTADPVVTSPPS